MNEARDQTKFPRELMRFLLIIVALFLCSASKSAFAAETRDLILVAGQSNAVGYDAKASELPADAADKEILFWWRTGDPPPDGHDSTSGGKWTHLQSQPKGNPVYRFGNFANADGGFGPEIGLARGLYAKGDKQLAILKAAWNGTSMTQAWNPADPGDGGSCYRALVSEIKAALAAARSQWSSRYACGRSCGCRARATRVPPLPRLTRRL
jgi:hypothetical protein